MQYVEFRQRFIATCWNSYKILEAPKYLVVIQLHKF